MTNCTINTLSNALAQMPLLLGLPFVGILLSIALLPILTPHFWHKRFGWICAFWAACTIIPLYIQCGTSHTVEQVMHMLTKEYLPFIILIGSLYTISNGIKLDLHLPATPALNSAFLFTGSILASILGTTGASVLLIKPFLNINKNRTSKAHLVIFFIFCVSNIGGCLSAIGDPPLMLGYLRGIEFFWVTKHLSLPFLIVMGPLLTIFYAIDQYFYQKNPKEHSAPSHLQSIHIAGLPHIALLIVSICTIFYTSDLTNNVYIANFGLKVGDIVRDIMLILAATCSFQIQKKAKSHKFSWGPIKEIALLFIGIFITVMPILSMLEQGQSGPLGAVFHLVAPNGIHDNRAYFWITGLLSSFLDNAPTYLVFFHLTGQSAEHLMTTHAQTLTAISAGAVFMGALTYIGNAPNFLVKAIAQSQSVHMPSFFAYIAWSSSILIPVFILFSWVYF